MKNVSYLFGALLIGAVAGVLIAGTNSTDEIPVVAQEAAPEPLTVPEDAVKLTECIPFMGEHWARPEDLPSGPIYVVHEEEIVALEYMIFEDRLEGEASRIMAGPDHESAIPVTMPSFGVDYDHMDLGYQPHGHEGMWSPHYDIHFYLISEEEKFQICPPPAPALEAMGVTLEDLPEVYGNLYPLDGNMPEFLEKSMHHEE